MPRVPVENNDRMSLRIAPSEKSLLMRAAALQHSNLTEFVVRTVVAAAREVIEQNEQVELTDRDSRKRLGIYRVDPTRSSRPFLNSAAIAPAGPAPI